MICYTTPYWVMETRGIYTMPRAFLPRLVSLLWISQFLFLLLEDTRQDLVPIAIGITELIVPVYVDEPTVAVVLNLVRI